MERKCPKCGSLSAVVGHTFTTLTNPITYTDVNGNIIIDDPNETTTDHICKDCYTVYVVKEYKNEIVQITAYIDDPKFKTTEEGVVVIASRE